MPVHGRGHPTTCPCLRCYGTEATIDGEAFEAPRVTKADGKPGRMCLLLAEDVIRLLYHDGVPQTGFKRDAGARTSAASKRPLKRK
jgi:hypothetical protein